MVNVGDWLMCRTLLECWGDPVAIEEDAGLRKYVPGQKLCTPDVVQV